MAPSRSSRVLRTISLILIVGLFCPFVYAKVIQVDDDGQADFDNIQAGIDAAVDGDTVLAPPGEYVITEPISFRGKAITVKSEAGRDETTIRMGTPADTNRSSVVVFENGENIESVLDGFTITGGRGCRLWFTKIGEAPIFWWEGGGILFNASSGTVRNCAIAQNRGDAGGALIVLSGSSVILTNCIINENSATNPEGAGGGICCTGDSSMTITKCIVRDNSAMGAAGGVISYDNSSLTMTNCEIIGNTAGRLGGGIYVMGALATLTNCVFARNTGGWGGGGVSSSYQVEAFIEISNCTITGNSGAADAGGGGVLAAVGSTTITNSIIYENTSDKGPDISLVQGGKLSIAYSNVADGQARVNVEGSSILDWGPGNIDADPLFARLGYWDDKGTRDPSDDVWIESDYHLKSQAGRWDPNSQAWVQDDMTSPCIDAGDPVSPIGWESFPNGGFVNMGAYGATAKASRSYFGEPICATIIAGDINGDCQVNRADLEIMALHWTDDVPLPLP